MTPTFVMFMITIAGSVSTTTELPSRFKSFEECDKAIPHIAEKIFPAVNTQVKFQCVGAN